MSKYRNTASHHKTLDVIGSVKNFNQLSLDELKSYCQLGRDIEDCGDVNEVSDFLHKRYGWNAESRLNNIQTCWNDIIRIQNEDDDDDDKISIKNENDEINNTSLSSIKESTIPIIIKSSSWDKNILICETDDQELNFHGDLGAIGRISSTSDSLIIDLKGRQYKGTIFQGPTIMMLNLAPPVGLAKDAYKETARVEVLSNEYCHLSFEKDIIGNMKGNYSGFLHDNIDGEGNNFASADNILDSDDDNFDDDNQGKSKKKAPIISTITNRSRKSSGKSKKVVKSKKKS